MRKIVNPSSISGRVDAPPSKSVTQRAIAAGLLADGVTLIRNISLSNDSLSAIGMAESLGAATRRYGDTLEMTGGKKAPSEVVLHCGESGLALRMFSPIAASLCRNATITGEGSLMNRPVTMISEALSQLGAEVISNGKNLPLRINGRIRGGGITIDGSTGSQLLTGLLMALPLLNEDSGITVVDLKSKPYIELTLRLLADFGITVVNRNYEHFSVAGRQSYKACSYRVEGDWSGAAFLLVASAIAGPLTVGNIRRDSAQADRVITDAISMAGAEIVYDDDTATVTPADLHAFSYDATDCPDLFPPLAALASYCTGTSTIKGVSRLKHKESDRANTIISVLHSLGVTAREKDDTLYIDGGSVRGAQVSSYNDHRIAMMAAVMALGSNAPVIIDGAEAVSKSFPDFFERLSQAGVSVK